MSNNNKTNYPNFKMSVYISHNPKLLSMGTDKLDKVFVCVWEIIKVTTKCTFNLKVNRKHNEESVFYYAYTLIAEDGI